MQGYSFATASIHFWNFDVGMLNDRIRSLAEAADVPDEEAARRLSCKLLKVYNSLQTMEEEAKIGELRAEIDSMARRARARCGGRQTYVFANPDQ